MNRDHSGYCVDPNEYNSVCPTGAWIKLNDKPFFNPE